MAERISTATKLCRPATSAKFRACKRRRGLTFRTWLLSSLLLSQGVRPATCTVLSNELREFADTQLLFWSGFDCVIDAALNFFGPIDDFLRDPTLSSTPLKERQRGGEDRDESSSSTTFYSSTSTSDVAPLGVFLENHTGPLLREARTILSNFVRTAKGENMDDNDDDEQGDEKEGETETETKDESYKTPSIATDKEINYDDNSDWEDTQNHNHSNLQVRGGGRRQKFEFSLYQEGDGSEKDPDGIPQRYLDMHNGNREMARKSLADTLQWRKEQRIDTILARPHPKFDICKQVFPTSFLGRDPDDHVIFLQRPALMDMDLAKRNKLKKEDLLEHYIYLNEYLWQIAEADKPMGTMVSVLDLSGLNMSVLRKREYINFLKLFVSVMDSHYPQRAHKTLVVNAPKWVNTIYRVLSPLLREETKNKIEIHSKNKKQDEALKRYLGPKAIDKLPASFWSKNKSRRKKKSNHNDNNNNHDEKEETSEETAQLPESDLDAKLRAHVRTC